MTLNIGILLALACAVATQLGFLYKHRGANAAPEVDIRHPLKTVKSLFASKWFAVGMGVGAGAWLLHVAAISLAPLSVVQAVLSGGLVLLAVMADRLFGFKIGPRQWWGLGMTCVGLILLAITLPKTHGAHSSFSSTAMIAFEAGLFGLGALFIAVVLAFPNGLSGIWADYVQPRIDRLLASRKLKWGSPWADNSAAGGAPAE